MKKRQVGRTNIEVDVLGVGGAPLGGNFAELDRAQAAALQSSSGGTPDKFAEVAVTGPTASASSRASVFAKTLTATASPPRRWCYVLTSFLSVILVMR